GCGAVGKIIMVVIAVVVTVYTAGALSTVAGSATFGQTMAAGMATLSGTGTVAMGSAAASLGLGSAGAAAVAGAVGSIASQVVGNAIGAQNGFSWKGVALSALGSGVTSALGSSGLLPQVENVFGKAALRQAVSSTISQGVGTVTGLQSSFDWKSVAAGAVGAGVGDSVGQALQNANAFSGLSDFGTALARGTVSGFAGGLVTAVMRGGRVSVQQVATDAFGNALGEKLALKAAQGSQEEVARDSSGMVAGTGMRPGGGLGLSVSSGAVNDWSREIDGGIQINGSMAPEMGNGGWAIVERNQGPIAALAAAGLDANQQRAMYGQMLASGQILRNAQGVPLVRTGQVLNYDLGDMGAASLGAQAIAQESRNRAERLAAEAQLATSDNRDVRDIRQGFAYRAMLDRGLNDAAAYQASQRQIDLTSSSVRQWDGRGTPVAEYLKSELGGLDAVRGTTFETQVARSLPAAAANEVGGLVLAGVLSKGMALVGGAAIRSEASLLNAELNATIRARLGMDLPVGAPMEGIVGRLDAGSALNRFGNVRDIPPLTGEADFIGPMKPSNWDALTAHPDGHAFSVHGGGVTDADLVVRARTGVKPDGSTGPIPPLSSGFYSDSLLISTDQTIRNGGGLANSIARQPGQSVVRVETQDVGDLGMDLGYGYVRLGATGNKTANAAALGPIQRIDGLNSAQGIYELNPVTGVWETITVYPAPHLKTQP
ncbi:hypothetical protein, partial [Paracidovorax anthurii]